jgi:hypothetical protein
MKRKHTQIPFFVVAFFVSFCCNFLLIIFFQGNLKTEKQDQNASNEQLTTHTFSRGGRGKMLKKDTLSLPLSEVWSPRTQAEGLLEVKQKVYMDWGNKGLLGSMIYSNKVYITTSSGVCQAQTQMQEQRVLGSNQTCAALGFKHNVYSDSRTMCTQTRIGAQGCNQTRIQVPSVLRLDQ